MKFNRDEPAESNYYQATNTDLILDSHAYFLHRNLLPRSENSVQLAKNLYHAPFVVLAHESAPDPVFFYANLQAQHLFEMSWQEMVTLPSRLSAEPLAREERQRLLDRVSSHGYIDNYTGIRISKTGKRFLIENATVWNLIDSAGLVVGQTAAFTDWSTLA